MDIPLTQDTCAYTTRPPYTDWLFLIQQWYCKIKVVKATMC